MPPEIRALTFDVFGTVVDWRGSVLRQLRSLGEEKSIETDWESFVDSWRYDGYMGGMRRVFDGELPLQTADSLHRLQLDKLLAERGIALSEDETDHLNRAWHRLDPWPDSVGGLQRLRSRFVVSTLSNGNISLLADMAKHAGLPWDCLLAADVTGAFKPQPECYQRAAEILDCEPAEVMMVAAHKGDLKAAAAVGFRTAFIPRPDEAGPSRDVDLSPDPSFDYVAPDFHALAAQLAC